VYVDDQSGNDVVALQSITPLLTLNHLTLGHTYKVTVSAFNEIGEGQKSTQFDLHTGVKPMKLTGASAPKLKSSTTTSITIAWLPPAYNGGASLAKYLVYHDIG
jgi:hypothetical protein